MYEVDNCLALVQYEYANVATTDYRAIYGYQGPCLSEGDELDQYRAIVVESLRRRAEKKGQNISS